MLWGHDDIRSAVQVGPGRINAREPADPLGAVTASRSHLRRVLRKLGKCGQESRTGGDKRLVRAAAQLHCRIGEMKV